MTLNITLKGKKPHVGAWVGPEDPETIHGLSSTVATARQNLAGAHHDFGWMIPTVHSDDEAVVTDTIETLNHETLHVVIARVLPVRHDMCVANVGLDDYLSEKYRKNPLGTLRGGYFLESYGC